MDNIDGVEYDNERYNEAHQLLKELFAESGTHKQLFGILESTHPLTSVTITNTHVKFMHKGKLTLVLSVSVNEEFPEFSYSSTLINTEEIRKKKNQEILEFLKKNIDYWKVYLPDPPPSG